MSLTIVTLKAFGDFVIASSALSRVQPMIGIDSPTVVACEHVRTLALALGLNKSIKFIGDECWTDVPAAYDIRKRGVFAALLSLNDLRNYVNSLPASMELVFDHLGWRERYIAGQRFPQALLAASGNIYIAYDNFFQSFGFNVLKCDPGVTHSICQAFIIPGARMAHRIIPAHVISALTSELRQRNITSSVVVLEGESIDIPTGVQVMKLPRSFQALVNVVKGGDLIISADSLPSHLSEFLGVPIFVLTPYPKPYWLPRSSFQTNGWATFANIQPFRTWISKYLN